MSRNRRADWRRVKSLLSYTLDDVARLLKVHRGTVRNWIKQGLPVLRERRPHLILGRDLIIFLKATRKARKRLCGPGKLYCLKCREPRRPVAGLVEYRRTAAPGGALVAVCEKCGTRMFRFLPHKRALAVAAEFGVQIEPRHESLRDSGISPLN